MCSASSVVVGNLAKQPAGSLDGGMCGGRRSACMIVEHGPLLILQCSLFLLGSYLEFLEAYWVA